MQQPLTETEQQQLANMNKELGELRQKLFQWALLAIEENLTMSSLVEQQVKDFDKAEFLLFKSTEQLKRNRPPVQAEDDSGRAAEDGAATGHGRCQDGRTDSLSNNQN
jgi:hypothetical protein